MKPDREEQHDTPTRRAPITGRRIGCEDGSPRITPYKLSRTRLSESLRKRAEELVRRSGREYTKELGKRVRIGDHNKRVQPVITARSHSRTLAFKQASIRDEVLLLTVRPFADDTFVESRSRRARELQ